MAMNHTLVAKSMFSLYLETIFSSSVSTIRHLSVMNHDDYLLSSRVSINPTRCDLLCRITKHTRPVVTRLTICQHHQRCSDPSTRDVLRHASFVTPWMKLPQSRLIPEGNQFFAPRAHKPIEYLLRTIRCHKRLHGLE